MWTNMNCARYDRSKLRYPSDLTDDEWGLVELSNRIQVRPPFRGQE